VPFAIRWREFRIELLPWLAFASTLVLAGVLWHWAVVPLTVAPGVDPPRVLAEPQGANPGLGSAAVHQASDRSTNGLREPTLRD
jgi:hypothetical protein